METVSRKRVRDVCGLSGKWAELHPRHPSPVLYQRVLYPTLDHAFAAALARSGALSADAKRSLAADETLLLLAAQPAHHVQASDRISIMRDCLRDKLMRHPHIKQILLDTEDASIVHIGDSVDEFWGVRGGIGSNHLGKLLEAVRLEISSGRQVAMWVASICKPFPADGAPRVTVTVERKGELVETRQLDSARALFTIGKFESSDFVLAHPSSSRKHALLAFDRDSPTGLVLLDLASKAGSTLEGIAARALEPTDVRSGTEIVFGLGSSRTYKVTIDQSHVIGALEQKREKLHAEIASMERAVVDGSQLFGLAPSKQLDPTKLSIFIANLPYEVEAEDLKELLEAYGPVKRVHLPLDKETSKPRGIAFVDYESAAHAHAACALDGEDFAGRTLRVELAGNQQSKR